MPPRQRILVIEDEPAIRRGIVDALRFEGFETREAEDGAVALQLVQEADCHLVLLDLVLPKVGGLQILKKLRATHASLPVIILTAMGDETDRVAGLKLGADDYVVKPFSVLELMARIEAVLRRSLPHSEQSALLEIDGGVVDFARREVRYSNGSRQELSEREAEVLAYLAQHSGRVIAREELLENVWHLSPRGLNTRTIDMHVARLREKLNDDPTNPRLILTVRGRGYLYGPLKEQP